MPKCPFLAFKCHLDAFLAKYCLTGASAARLMVKVAPGVKMLPQDWKWAQPCRKRTPDHPFITFWSFSFKPLKNGLKNGENYLFSKSDKTLGGPSTCSYDSIKMPSMTKNTDTKALITSQGRNNKTITPALEERVKNTEIIGRLFNSQ